MAKQSTGNEKQTYCHRENTYPSRLCEAMHGKILYGPFEITQLRCNGDFWVVARGERFGDVLAALSALFIHMRQCMGIYIMVCAISQNHGDLWVVVCGQMVCYMACSISGARDELWE